MANELLRRGIYVIGFSYPVVPHGQARIRVEVLSDVRHRPATPLIESSEPAFRNERRTVSTIGLPGIGRSQPAPGEVSLVALDRYKAMVDGCRERGITPVTHEVGDE